MTALGPHLATGLTTICRAWAVTRRDGVTLGFTDHDRGLSFDGIAFRADGGMTARAMVQSTGLAVDNTEALGILSSPTISEVDIAAGRYDGAEVRAWAVNWTDPDQRDLRFRGTIGEVRRADGAFTADLRGLTEALNQPQGRAYLRSCSAILGDAACGFDLATPGYSVDRIVETVTEARVFGFADFATHDPGWFARGRVTVLTGLAQGLMGVVKGDRSTGSARVIDLWQALGADIAPGDLVRFDAGCDKRMVTCRAKFANIVNFRGFPDIPGEDWLLSSPLSAGSNDGGSLRS